MDWPFRHRRKPICRYEVPGCYEGTGGTILLRGHRAMESITLDREVGHLKDELMLRYANSFTTVIGGRPSAKCCKR